MYQERFEVLEKKTEEAVIKNEILESLYNKNESFKKEIFKLRESLSEKDLLLDKRTAETESLMKKLKSLSNTQEKPTFTTINNFIVSDTNEKSAKTPRQKCKQRRVESNLIV